MQNGTGFTPRDTGLPLDEHVIGSGVDLERAIYDDLMRTSTVTTGRRRFMGPAVALDSVFPVSAPAPSPLFSYSIDSPYFVDKYYELAG